MKKILMSLALVTIAFGDCEVHLKKAHNAFETFTSCNTAEYYIKWSNIAIMHLGFYTSCLQKEQNFIIEENHKELILEIRGMAPIQVVDHSKTPTFGTGY